MASSDKKTSFLGSKHSHCKKLTVNCLGLNLGLSTIKLFFFLFSDTKGNKLERLTLTSIFIQAFYLKVLLQGDSLMFDLAEMFSGCKHASLV
jgi:hypothetical protein